MTRTDLMTHKAFLALSSTCIPPLKVGIDTLLLLQGRKVKEDKGVATA